MTNLSASKAWDYLFDKYNIIQSIKKDGYYEITANQIKEFKEPRLMAKWDSSESLPSVFKNNKVNILPNSRRSYILSDFKLYQELPISSERVINMQKVEIPEFESINIKNITSESNAINLLVLSKILDDFLDEDDNVATFNGRMGTGKFNFNVDRHRGSPLNMTVNKAQCEIDGCFENDNSVVILEAKNIVNPDFNIRQLYFPYRLWQQKVHKPIRLIFSIYSNEIYRLLEYQFEEISNFSSIKLIKEKNYSLQDTEINNQDLWEVYQKAKILYDDNQDKTNIPFIQADTFERIISLMEILNDEPITTNKISEIMQFDFRQADYYFNAGRYLNLFKKEAIDERGVLVHLTSLGKKVHNLNYKNRQLKLVELILNHKIFHRFFFETYTQGTFPTREAIKIQMKEYNVCNEGQIDRRSGSVLAWIKWIFSLTNI